VRGVLDLRAGGEVLLGWWHLHPEFCARCPEQSRARCAFRRPFFSNEDVALHAACFPRAWQVALLVSDLGEPELRVNLFGWRDAMIAERGFFSHARRRLDAALDARPAAGVQRQVGGKRQ
jgi:hypothetical protein